MSEFILSHEMIFAEEKDERKNCTQAQIIIHTLQLFIIITLIVGSLFDLRRHSHNHKIIAFCYGFVTFMLLSQCSSMWVFCMRNALFPLNGHYVMIIVDVLVIIDRNKFNFLLWDVDFFYILSILFYRFDQFDIPYVRSKYIFIIILSVRSFEIYFR